MHWVVDSTDICLGSPLCQAWTISRLQPCIRHGPCPQGTYILVWNTDPMHLKIITNMISETKSEGSSLRLTREQLLEKYLQLVHYVLEEPAILPWARRI